MSLASSFGSVEILQVADAVAREKGVEKDSIIEAMEESIAIAARKKYGYGRNLLAEIDKSSGSVSLFRQLTVVEKIEIIEEDEESEDGESAAEIAASQVTLEEAKVKHPDAKIGDVIREPLPPIDLGRVAAQTAKQVITQKVREAERERQFEDFKDRVGEVINGLVKRVEFGNIIVDLGRAEAIIERDQSIKGEMFKVNDRVRAYLYDVRRENKGAQLFLSRTKPELMEKLFAQEVPEIYDGIISIKAVAREPGSRAKIAVFSSDSNIDPVGSCVGVRGSRVQAVINELQGEKIDIVEWSADTATFVIRALAPAEVSKVIIDEDSGKIEVVVPDDQLSLAIGRKGQNVRLAASLVGWKVDISTEEEESTRRTDEFNRTTQLFVEALNVEEIIAQLLATEGFGSVEEIAYTDLSDLAGIEGFDEDVASELQARATEFLDQRKTEIEAQLKELGVKDDLKDFRLLSADLIVKLGQQKICSLDDFADLSREEFVELIPDSGLEESKIDEIIMEARAHWFEDEPKDDGSDADGDAKAEAKGDDAA